jgi:TRAP-type mannitol/chloroaromatic compound transport system substrate-binding protein
MKRHASATTLALAALAGGALLATSVTAQAQDRVRWKLGSSYPSTLNVLGENAPRLLENIETMTDGNFRIEFFEPGALVPALEVFDAVSTGSIDASYTSPGFHQGKVPHLIFFGSVPFGPGVEEYMAWIQAGGGYEIYDREYQAHNIKGFQCGIVVAESSGWFRQEIASLDDLKGMKMRFYGLGADVMQRLGVNTQLLAPADIYPALERGVIDAAEYSYPSQDQQLGFYQIAKHNYFPGWHQQASFVELIMNLDRWNELPEAYKKIVEIACGEANMWALAEAEAQQADAIAFHEDNGVQIHEWPPEVLEAFRENWEEVAKDRAAADPKFKEVYDSYSAFREKYSRWRDVGYLQ